MAERNLYADGRNVREGTIPPEQESQPQALYVSTSTLSAIQNERFRQHRKFGHEPLSTPMEFGITAGEEYGEICRALCQGKNIEEVRKEAIQLAAVCIAWLDGDLHFGNEK